MDSLGTGTGFQDWTVSEPESESKKLEPGTSAAGSYQVIDAGRGWVGTYQVMQIT